jgi:hypothetical protein
MIVIVECANCKADYQRNIRVPECQYSDFRPGTDFLA